MRFIDIKLNILKTLKIIKDINLNMEESMENKIFKVIEIKDFCEYKSW